MRRRDQPMPEALVEQRRREDAAPRLREEIADLQSLRIRLDDVRAEGRVVIASYVRPIMVATAPAHFELRCMEPRCDGRHDLTRDVLRALHKAQVSFSGQSSCPGMVGPTPCDRLLEYTCDATYGAKAHQA